VLNNSINKLDLELFKLFWGISFKLRSTLV